MKHCVQCGCSLDDETTICPNCNSESLKNIFTSDSQKEEDNAQGYAQPIHTQVNQPYNQEKPIYFRTQPESQRIFEEYKVPTEQPKVMVEEPKAWLQALCVFYPIIGLIMYLVKQSENEQLAKAYGKVALWGFIYALIPVVIMVIIWILIIFAVGGISALATMQS